MSAEPKPASLKKTSPPVCPTCHGSGRMQAAFLVCEFAILNGLEVMVCPRLGRMGQCAACGGAGAIPSAIAAIADDGQRRRALVSYVVAVAGN